MGLQVPAVKPLTSCVGTVPVSAQVLRLDDPGEVLLVANLLRSTVALRPDDLHFLPILTLETFDLTRNPLVEEVGIGRMRVYVVVVRGWLRCLCDPLKVPV